MLIKAGNSLIVAPVIPISVGWPRARPGVITAIALIRTRPGTRPWSRAGRWTRFVLLLWSGASSVRAGGRPRSRLRSRFRTRFRVRSLSVLIDGTNWFINLVLLNGSGSRSGLGSIFYWSLRSRVTVGPLSSRLLRSRAGARHGPARSLVRLARPGARMRPEKYLNKRLQYFLFYTKT